jgi:hypothetical protein
MIKFQAKYLKMLYPFMAQRDIRYYLNAIHIEPHADGGAILCATNGHMMLIIRDVEAVCTEQQTFKLNRDALRYCAPMRGSLIKPMVYINPITERLTISDIEEKYIQPGKCLSALPVSGYPKYEKVIPKFSALKPGFVDSVNSRYIHQVVQLAFDKKHRFEGVRFWQTGKNSAIAVEFPQHSEIIGIIMPMHGDSNPLVSWIKNFAPRPEVIA